MNSNSSRLLIAFRPSPKRLCRPRPAALAALGGAAAFLLAASATAGTAVWNWTAGDRNWSTPGNWSGGIPASTNDVVLGNIDAQTATTPVNTVDTTTTARSLSYTNSSAGAYTSYQNTVVAAGRTLTLTNGLNVGVGNSVGYAGNPYTYASITGTGGAVAVTGGNVQVGYQSGSATAYLYALLDLRGLDNFTYSNSAGTFGIAGGGQRRAGGEVYLAGTNGVVASAVTLGSGAAGLASSPGKLHLGSSNFLFTDTITVGKIVAGNVVDFQTGLNNPMATIRAKDGVNGVGNWYLGWNNQGNQNVSSSSGTNDFSAGLVDAVVTNLYVGYFSSGISTAGRYANGTFTLGTNAGNSLIVQNLFVGDMALSTSASSSSSVGVFNVFGGTVSAGTVTLAQQLGSGVATATLVVSNASLRVSGDLVEGGGTSTITVDNATLNVGGRIGAPATIVQTMNLSNAALGLTLVAPGDYTKAAASVGALNIDGGNGSTLLTINSASPAPGQYPLIAYSSLGGAAGFAGLSVQAPAGTTATLSNNTTQVPSTIDIIITAGQLSWSGAQNGNWDIGTTANWKSGSSATTYNESGGVGSRVLFDDTAAGTTSVNLTTTLSPLGVTVNTTNKDYTFGGSGKLSGAGGLIKQGPGMLTLMQTGVDDYAGSTYVGDGTLQIGNGGTAGMVGPGPLTMDGTVVFNRSDDLTLSNAVSGLGGLNKLGGNTLTLAGAITYAGPTALGGGALVLSPSGVDTLPGNITGNGRLRVAGAGTVVLSGNGNSYTGGTLVSSGTLQIGDGVNAGSLAGDVTNLAALVFDGGYYTVNNAISGPGSVTSIGSGGVLVLAGANTYTGPTTIKNGGTLTLGAASGMSSQSALLLGETGGNSIGAADFTGYSVAIAGLTVGGNQIFPNTLTLSSGQTLTVNGNVSIGNTGSAGAKANLTVTGPGASLIVSTNGGTVQLGLSTSGSGTGANNVNCDLTGLDVFVADLGPTGGIGLGETNLNTANNTPSQILHLAATNRITAATLGIGSGGKGITPEFHLGSGTNVLNIDLIRLGYADGVGRDSGKLLFDSGSGSVAIHGSGGGSTRANLNLLVGNSATTAGSTNTVDLTGHYASLWLSTLTMGDQANRAAAWSNYFGFDQGVLDATSVSLSKACLAGVTGTSWMHLGGGTVTFGALALASSSASATLDIAGGQVTVNSTITKTGSGAGTVQVASAALLVNGGIASPAVPMDVISLAGAQLSLGRSLGYGNPAIPLANAGSLTLSSPCSLALTGTNYVTGQFPLISYAGSIGGDGFAAITTFTPPPGVSATLVNNAANHSIDVQITAAPPPGPREALAFMPGPGTLDLWWADLGMTLQTNAVSVASPTNWFVYPGSTAWTNVSIPIVPGSSNVFFRLVYP